MKLKHALTYDDVLLVPKYSTVKSRGDVSLECGFYRDAYDFPVIPANMKTIMGPAMGKAIIDVGGLAILHRFMPFKDQLEMWRELPGEAHQAGMSIGIKESDRENARKMINVGVQVICIDVAHGDSEACVDMTKWLRDAAQGAEEPVMIIAGNVATGEGALRLWNAGANVVKVGIGPGSLCSTRIETGNGVPQLSALMDVYKARKKWVKYNQNNSMRPMGIIADGGIKSAGDCVKALCFADMVMSGNLFAGTDQTPGQQVYVDGKPHKSYAGSSTHKSNHVEGVTVSVPCAGPVGDVIRSLQEGISSGCSYQGVDNLYDLKKNPKFVLVTNAGLKESHPHAQSK